MSAPTGETCIEIVATCEVLDPDGTVVQTATGTFTIPLPDGVDPDTFLSTLSTVDPLSDATLEAP